MASTFEVLAEESRRRILDLLVAGERPVGDLVCLLSLSQPAISKHLKILRESGLVESRTDAQRRIYQGQGRTATRGRRVAGALPPAVGEPPERPGAPSRDHG